LRSPSDAIPWRLVPRRLTFLSSHIQHDTADGLAGFQSGLGVANTGEIDDTIDMSPKLALIDRFRDTAQDFSLAQTVLVMTRDLWEADIDKLDVDVGVFSHQIAPDRPVRNHRADQYAIGRNLVQAVGEIGVTDKIEDDIGAVLAGLLP
jgi:hypothetical protein